MLIVYKGEPNQIVVTATELTTQTNPIFVFEFTHHQSTEQVGPVVLSNESLSPERYDEFIIDEGVNVTFPYTGDYTYRIKEQQTSTILEVGRLIVKEAKPADDIYQNDITSTIYDGEQTN